MKKTLLVLSTLALSLSVAAKLPAPSEEAKAQAAKKAEAAAHDNKVNAYKLCKTQDKVVAHYLKTKKPATKASAPATPPCVDPGAFKPAA